LPPHERNPVSQEFPENAGCRYYFGCCEPDEEPRSKPQAKPRLTRPQPHLPPHERNPVSKVLPVKRDRYSLPTCFSCARASKRRPFTNFSTVSKSRLPLVWSCASSSPRSRGHRERSGRVEDLIQEQRHISLLRSPLNPPGSHATSSVLPFAARTSEANRHRLFLASCFPPSATPHGTGRLVCSRRSRPASS
jgi:hypothetical protein